MIKLWDDQKQTYNDTRNAMRISKAVLLACPTGSGKTVLASAVISGTQAKRTRCIFTVPRRELLKQTSKTFNNYDIPHSYVASGMPFNPHAITYIATVGTLANRIKNQVAPDCDLLIVDEAHWGSGALDVIISYYKARGAYILGLSATPTKPDGRGLGDWYDSLVFGKPMRWLIDNGRLSDYRIFAPNVPDLTGIRSIAGDYSKGALNEKMEADRVLVGDAVTHYKKHAAGLLGVTYTTSLKHSQLVCDAFNQLGVPAETIDGTMNDVDRTAIIRRFATRQTMQLVNCQLLTFGFDLASAAGMDVTIECMSDLQPTQSLALQMQKWGRVLRKKPNPALIFDHAGNVGRHGMPCDDRDWQLEGFKSVTQTGERASPVRTCAECYFTHKPAPSCPSCGYVYPVQSRDIEEVAGDLVEVKRGEKLIKPPPSPAQLAKQRWALIHNAQKRGIPNPHDYADKILKRQAEKRNAN